MSDLPNFPKKTWLRRVGLVRLLLAVAGTLVAAIAWGEQTDFLNDISIELTSPGHLSIGEPSNLSITIKNNNDLTIKFTDLQVRIRLIKGTCLQNNQPSQAIFSLPQNISVGPNDVQTVMLPFSPIMFACDGSASSEIISVVQRDAQRVSTKWPGPPIEIL